MLGRIGYEDALTLQRSLHAQVAAGEHAPVLLMLEHNPVITVSRRASATGHVLAAPDRLAELGIEVCQTDRGGDVTYHGPGQLVVYPILRLGELGLSLGRYVRWLEQVLIELLEVLGVPAERDPTATGVWVRPTQKKGSADGAACGGCLLAKIAAIGVRYSRGVTLHGLAFNIQPDMRHFATIVPCGLAGRPVIDLRSLLDRPPPSVMEVGRMLSEIMVRHIQSMQQQQASET